MARSFTAASSQSMTSTVTIGTLITNTTGSFSCWHYPTGTAVTAPADDAWTLPGLFQDIDQFCALTRGILGGLDRVWAYNWDGNEDRVGATYTNDTWAHFGWMHSAGTLHVFKDGASAGTIASGNTGGTAGTISAGNSYWPEYLSGRLAEMAFWNVALTTDEWNALGKGVSPLIIRPASLTAYWPLLGYSSPELNVVNNAQAFTLVNTPTDIDHPSIQRAHPNRARIFPPAGAGGPIPGMIPIVWQQYRRRHSG